MGKKNTTTTPDATTAQITPASDELEQLRAENAKLMAKLKALDEVKASNGAEVPPKQPTEEKLVKIRLPLLRGEENSDVFVAVNNRSWLIKRGEDVEVPECVVEVLRNQEEMMKTAVIFESKKQNQN